MKESAGLHTRFSVLVTQTTRVGFYWLFIFQDSKDLVKKCDKCQRFAPVSRQPPTEMTTITSPWPFY
jgi:hypothetical protein